MNNLSVFHNIGRLNSYSSVYNLLNLAWPQRREIGKIKPLVERLGLVENLFKPTGEPEDNSNAPLFAVPFKVATLLLVMNRYQLSINIWLI